MLRDCVHKAMRGLEFDVSKLKDATNIQIGDKLVIFVDGGIRKDLSSLVYVGEIDGVKIHCVEKLKNGYANAIIDLEDNTLETYNYKYNIIKIADRYENSYMFDLKILISNYNYIMRKLRLNIYGHELLDLESKINYFNTKFDELIGK
ncbi:MAG: hypothetical protein ACRC7S_10315 [Cetobacterium sp.]